MTSTLLDVTLCLLLVSAGVVTLSTTHTREPVASEYGDEAATVLAASTTTVNYTLAPGARRANESLVQFPATSGPEFRRTAHGTLAELLGTATMGRVAADGARLTHARDDLATAVSREVLAAVGTGRTQVVAVWRPFPGSHLRARLAVGPRPPPNADVSAATLDTPSEAPAARHDAIAASGDGFDAVAAVAAARTVSGLFPPDAMRLALRGDYPVSALARHRYRRAGRVYGVDVGQPLREETPRPANARIERALRRRFERELRREFETPEAAARALRVGTVRIVVRRWT